MTDPTSVSEPFEGRTAWSRSARIPLREFLRTETGGAVVLVAATLLAVVWSNLGPSSYQTIWTTEISLRVGTAGIAQNAQQWVNEGLMAFFFLVMGLEARREFDLGELRDRRRMVLPMVAAFGGMLIPVGLYLLMNRGHSSAHGWGAAMSTDTAFALGLLALVGRRLPPTVRTFVLTIAVADDLFGFAVIAIFYTRKLSIMPLLIGIGVLGLAVAVRQRGVRYGVVYAALGVVAWVAFLECGVDPVLVGVVLGLLAVAYPAPREGLERATHLFRLFREQPTSEYARTVREGVRTAISPNERLQQLYHPLSSYLIVPLFALANAGVAINGSSLMRAYRSPIALGIIAGLVIGKPAGIVGFSWLVTRLSRGRLRPTVGWGSVLSGGSVAGIGFTVSLLIATLAFTGLDLEAAKLGILTAGLCASAVSWAVLRVISRLPPRLRLRAVVGTAQMLTDLAAPVDVGRDHIRGPAAALVTLVEYGDFECPFCGQAEPAVRELLADFGDLRYVWRHLPLDDVHPHAQLAAEASEAAATQGKFWEMHDLLIAHPEALTTSDLRGYAQELGLDLDRFGEALRKRKYATRVGEDVESADLSAVSGTPTFFINGRRHHGGYDLAQLSAEVRAARARAAVADPARI
jgi:Na+/H+ antiporter NhaA